MTGPGFAGNLRSSARNFGWGNAYRPGTDSIRKGAVRTILEAGGSFAQLLKAGQWRSSAYRHYVDIGAGETNAMAPILIGDSGDVGPGRRESQGDGGPRA